MHQLEPPLHRGEKILYVTRYHWIYYFRALLPLLATIGLGSILWLLWQNELLAALSLVGLFVSMGWFVLKWVEALIKRAFVTNQRLIYRQGYAHRNIVDVTLDRIGGVIVDQDLPQRLLGHGTVKVILPVIEMILPRYLDNPVTFRNAIVDALKKPPEPPPAIVGAQKEPEEPDDLVDVDMDEEA